MGRCGQMSTFHGYTALLKNCLNIHIAGFMKSISYAYRYVGQYI